MAHFYATIKGSRGEASRLGTKISGIRGHVRGWNCGVRTDGEHSLRDGTDRFDIYATAGSNGKKGDTFIGTVKENGEFILSEEIREKIEQDVRKMIRDSNRPVAEQIKEKLNGPE